MYYHQMMRRVTVTIPDDLEEDLDRFLASHELRPSVASLLRAALRQYISGVKETPDPPNLARVLANRTRIRELAAKRRVDRIRVFGSVVRGEATHNSDIDFLVSPGADCGLFDLGSLQVELEELLGVEVDVQSDRSMPAELRHELEAEAIPL